MTMRLLLAAMLVAVAFVVATASALPPVVASHFAAGGSANGFMPRSAYLILILALLVVLPLLIAATSRITRNIPLELISLPHRDYWLAPEHRAETLDFISTQGCHFGILLVAFLCFVHWLVVLANGQQPPHFPESLFLAGLGTFLAGVIAWLVRFITRFRRPE